MRVTKDQLITYLIDVKGYDEDSLQFSPYKDLLALVEDKEDLYNYSK